MKTFMEYFETICKQFDLTLKVEKSKYMNWEVKMFKKGYDMPFVRVKDKDIDKAFELAKGMLILSLYVS